MHEDGEKDFQDNNVPEVPYDWLNRFCGKVEFFHNECMYNCTLYIVHILYIKIQDVKCVRRPLFGVLSYKFSRSCSFAVICMLCSARMLTLKYAAVQQSRPSLHNSCGVVVGCSWLYIVCHNTTMLKSATEENPFLPIEYGIDGAVENF